MQANVTSPRDDLLIALALVLPGAIKQCPQNFEGK